MNIIKLKMLQNQALLNVINTLNIKELKQLKDKCQTIYIEKVNKWKAQMTKDLEYFGLNSNCFGFRSGGSSFYMLIPDEKHKQVEFPAILLNIDMGSDMEVIGWKNEKCSHFRCISQDGCSGHSGEKYYPAVELKEVVTERFGKYGSAVLFFMNNHWIKQVQN